MSVTKAEFEFGFTNYANVTRVDTLNNGFYSKQTSTMTALTVLNLTIKYQQLTNKIQ